ncbi:phosphatidylserine/phosphatidylglycerophosphate/cardiolipin synthase family protein [Rhodococcus sp. T2V]|uniref:phosphatidylserine/phosphatidylglycerophosphate/ cardiolipin synthase family protein n=1 Tax=Rhodococcus sp. T2V TaxID=3034164 RepID=UPI0023E1C64E|nr:phosphatidylserine/phosphatidylglycerophosphate/cardiolipin synthase family protein [Rhodococcus sp. T2V]MDF3312167.1 phosphatidylserine/phosphatidylglycerophosphate/cardiolipin synthase family protein [Rhodococcus sp. T2V]
MGTTFHGPSPWPHITRAIRTRGSRRAAIAHLGQDAPTLLPLRGGDVLVVNASRAAVRAHLTSPVALAYYRDAGVRVLSSPDLHANVIATERWAVIGSANASHGSTIAVEGVVITDDPDLVASVRGFIDSIEEVTEVDQVFLDNAVAQWQIGRAVPIPGVSGRGQADPGFLPAQVNRMFLRHIIEFQPGPAEHHAWAAESRHRRAPAGPAAKYQLEWFHHDKTDSRLRRGDVLVFVAADHEWLYPPAVVDSEAIAIPRSPGAIGHLLRSRTDLDPIPVPVAEQILADAGHPGARLRVDHRIASPGLRAAVLGLWNL